MAEIQYPIRPVLPANTKATVVSQSFMNLPLNTANTSSEARAALDPFTSPVNQNGSFEFDRVVKSGTLQKRTQKTKTWKTVFLVLRPNAISMYKSDKETKLRHKLHLSDLTAVALLKDPKQKRKHVFGLFSPAKNYHFQASSDQEAQEWVDLLRSYARMDEEEEEMLLASPIGQRSSFMLATNASPNKPAGVGLHERVASGASEAFGPPAPQFALSEARRSSNIPDSSGYSGNELASHSDFSDSDIQRLQGMSIESPDGNPVTGGAGGAATTPATSDRPSLPDRNLSQASGLNLEQDPDRVIWQGWLWLLRNKGGVRQWKKYWALLRPRNFILYRDESEYTAKFIRPMSAIVDVVDIDPVSRTKINCLQLITEEKSYRFCAPDEESLIHCLGAFKSLIAKRKELEARAAAAAASSKDPA
ncbi:PH domain-containing protein [Plectosphaerella plurivora]|uniref:PH domain-containing protein n=1 Tax=Plectosphaerella plurivora TaxID=936078 RepID=A0A9P9AC32_9PEZI|nr:PH domain-containing protein [Plectosphaerella plurivora]